MKIARDSWAITERVIRRYPDQLKYYNDEVEKIIEKAPEVEPGMPKSAGNGNPTEARAMKIASDERLQRIKRELHAVKSVYDQLCPEHQKVIRIRFWSNRWKNMPYVWMEAATSYSDRQARRICEKFIRQVAERLGEI